MECKELCDDSDCGSIVNGTVVENTVKGSCECQCKDGWSDESDCKCPNDNPILIEDGCTRYCEDYDCGYGTLL